MKLGYVVVVEVKLKQSTTLLRYEEMVFKLVFQLHKFVIGVNGRRTYLHSIVMFVVTFNQFHRNIYIIHMMCMTRQCHVRRLYLCNWYIIVIPFGCNVTWALWLLLLIGHLYLNGIWQDVQLRMDNITIYLVYSLEILNNEDTWMVRPLTFDFFMRASDRWQYIERAIQDDPRH